MSGATHNSENDLAVFPGTFDPVTLGHMDIIRRGATIFSHVVVAVGCNPEKIEWFSPEERVELIRKLARELPNVSVRSYDGLTMDFVRLVGAKVILRGIRDTVDLRTELQAANTNLLVGDVETVFLMTSDQHALTSSTLIKQIVEMGGYDHARLARLVPREVIEQLEQHFGSGAKATLPAVHQGKGGQT
ncbi:MAG: pantetheine-phosphate adenylyltransferase [Phycisphaerae bacterium]|nr:pantetheine-phosphate adenylyltransferase [Phycisphaerae bacterium]